MAQQVFKRTEKKYLVNKESYSRLISALEQHMNKDRYFESDIVSVYFDTPDYRLIRTSLEKPVFKEKIRLRSYGTPKSDTPVFLEIKRKYKGVVYKRRSTMSLADAVNFINGTDCKNECEGNPQIENELKYAFDFYPDLAPRMLISYHRLAYVGKDDTELRITFDNKIAFRNYDLELSKGIYGRQLLNKGERIMEIKIPDGMPLWLAHTLDELKIYPASYSKYGNAYLTLLREGSLFSDLHSSKAAV